MVVLGNSKRETRLHWEDFVHLRIRSACSGGKYKNNSSLREQAVYYSTLNKNQYEQNTMEIIRRGHCFSFYPETWLWLVLLISADSLLWTSVQSLSFMPMLMESIWGFSCWLFFLLNKSQCFAVFAFCLMCWPAAIVCIAMVLLSPNKSL